MTVYEYINSYFVTVYILSSFWFHGVVLLSGNLTEYNVSSMTALKSRTTP